MASRSPSPLSSLSSSPSPTRVRHPHVPPPAPAAPANISNLEDENSGKEPFPELDATAPLDSPSGASSIEDARSAVHVHDLRPSRRPSVAGSLHKSDNLQPPASQHIPLPPPEDYHPRRGSDEDDGRRIRGHGGPPPPPSPPSPSQHTIPMEAPMPPQPHDSGSGGGSESEAERIAAKERRARKARARSRAQVHPPSPPPEPEVTERADPSVAKDKEREERRREKERLREERESERTMEKEVEFAKETKERPRRERRGSIGARERSEREKEKERERIRQKGKDREERRLRASEKEKERERLREFEREKERETTNDEKNSEEDRSKERDKDGERHSRRERKNSVRHRSDDKNDEEDRVKERHRRERRGSMRTKDREETIRPHNREREHQRAERERERDRERTEREIAAAATAISVAAATATGERDRHRRGTSRYQEFSDRDVDTGDDTDRRREHRHREREREREREPDVRFNPVLLPPHHSTKEHRHPSYRERDRETDESDFDRERERTDRAVPPPVAQLPHPARRSRRNSQPLPPSNGSPQRRQSLTERIRNKLRRDTSTRKRPKSPPATVVPPIVPLAPGAGSPSRERERDRDHRDRDRPISSGGPPHSPMGSPSIMGAEAGVGAAVAAAIAVANNPRTDPVDRLRAWMEQCNAKHGSHCSGPPQAAGTWRPKYLVDCLEFRLVQPEEDTEYAALSYVWGLDPGPPPTEANNTMTLSSNFNDFCDSLSNAEMFPAFMDAMWLVQKMGVRYLWIDRFCILQDDEAMRVNHVRNMPFLYSNASFTVVVALENVQLGLIPLDRKKAAPDSKALHADLLADSMWNLRAWTLQESIYSRRCVYVFHEVYTWECHCDTWQSNVLGLGIGANGTYSGKVAKLKGVSPTSALKCTARVALPEFAFRHTPWPDMDEYARIAMDYSRRRTTYVQDTLRAFTGITSVLSRTFASGFVFGMPVMFLDAAMLWKPSASIRRRVLPPASRGLDAHGAPGSPGPIPSWSWMGWFFDDMPLDTSIWRMAADYVDEAPPLRNRTPPLRHVGQFHFRLHSLVRYSLTDQAKSPPIPLAATGLEYRGQRIRKDADLPDGWAIGRDGYLRHARDPVTRFRYPIPVLPVADAGAEALSGLGGNLPGNILSFKAERAFLYVQLEAMKPASLESMGTPPMAIGRLVDRHGQFAGLLTSHDMWLGVQSCNHEPNVANGEKIEIVAISVAQERGGSAVMGTEVYKEFLINNSLEYFNVLWIERVGEVAYRRGLGHVLSEVWNELARTEVDMLLG